ncbi:unnamed protein product [Didymodactylos carnosus]|uniref:Amidase domain-containing protein n=1 Tax=Didymodactylos carnosus TaxID=1234261 RepID=A0A814H0D7_9BILA|nr:unnamed protein product [Didymodactylos carnosus]CAF1003974.1 unnamed protein product [Didymodactylos carnosus]CAF3570788.1 unnamed protein product [Didymodactylos carnosus]CAF3775316.1 unnamed protein product [Didymodactylos carnosus]
MKLIFFLLLLRHLCAFKSSTKGIDLLFSTISELQIALESNWITSRDLVTWYLERIDEVNKDLRAVIETNPDALVIAKQLDSERKEKGARSPLHGIPVLVKDNIATADKMNTTAGSYALLGSRVPRDAGVIYRLRKAGAIILGKASMSEWAAFRSTNETREGWSARGGMSASAYIKDGDPCGSSSGSGIAASIGLSAATLGTETDGSIVCPASRASIVGLKPTVGLTSRAGVIPISHTQDSVGPMAQTVRDVALVLEIIQGIDPHDNATLDMDAVRPCNYTQFLLGSEGFKNMRLGVVRRGIFDNSSSVTVSQEQVNAANDAIKLMKKLGAHIQDPADIETIDEINRSAAELTVLNTDFKQDIKAYLSELTNTNIKTLADLIQFNREHQDVEFSKYMINQNQFEASENTTGYDSDEYIQAVATSLRLGRKEGIDYTLDKYKLDALIMIGDGASTASAIARYPIISVPLGYLTKQNGINEALSGTPFGMLFTGRAWSEGTLLRLAHAFEQATHIREKVRPQFAPE